MRAPRARPLESRSHGSCFIPYPICFLSGAEVVTRGTQRWFANEAEDARESELMYMLTPPFVLPSTIDAGRAGSGY